jgi:Tfp pilus assembly protein PilP
MQSMLDRYHTNHYIRQEEQRLAKFQQRHVMLEETLGKGKISWADFKVDLEVKTQQ